MLLRAKPVNARLFVFALGLSLTACEEPESTCEPPELLVEPIGMELYAVGPVDRSTLYRNGTQIQLIGRTEDEPEFEVGATLSSAVLELIDGAEEALSSGESLGSFESVCLTFIDKPSVQLSLTVGANSLRFGYVWGCPPSGLTELDTALQELMTRLPSCEPTPLVTDCELRSGL